MTNSDLNTINNDLLLRLRKVEGQIRGLQNMIQEGKDCPSIITQLNAARGALDKVGLIILSEKLKDCIAFKDDTNAIDDSAFDEVMKLLEKLI
jgi:DNA-binding FrmR family transcriptional regulator